MQLLYSPTSFIGTACRCPPPFDVYPSVEELARHAHHYATEDEALDALEREVR